MALKWSGAFLSDTVITPYYRNFQVPIFFLYHIFLTFNTIIITYSQQSFDITYSQQGAFTAAVSPCGGL